MAIGWVSWKTAMSTSIIIWHSFFPTTNKQSETWICHLKVISWIFSSFSPFVCVFSNKYRVVGFEVETASIRHKDIKVDNKFNCIIPDKARPQLVYTDRSTQLYFTYSVEWIESSVSWASRWDIYLGMKDVQIHWFSIINSLVVVFFLSGIKLESPFIHSHRYNRDTNNNIKNNCVFQAS